MTGDINTEVSQAGTGSGGGGAVTIANGADITLGSKTDAMSPGDGVAGATLIAVLKQTCYHAGNTVSSLETRLQLIQTKLDQLHTDNNLQIYPLANIGASNSLGAWAIQGTAGMVPVVISGTTTCNLGTTDTANLASVVTNTTGLAKEAGGNLATIAAKDFATQTTLLAAKTDLDTIAAKDFATQTTLALVKSDLDSVVTNTTGLATQVTAAAAKADLDTIVTNTTGGATATKQDALQATMAEIALDTDILATPGQALKIASLPITRALDDDTIYERLARRTFEIAAWAAQDQMNAMIATRARERVSTFDRRGRYDRGSAR